MQQKKRNLLAVLVLLFLAFVAGVAGFAGAEFASPAYAQETGYEDEAFVQGSIVCSEKMDGITRRVVDCIKALTITVAKRFLDNIKPYVEATIIITMVLSVTFYGVMLAIGMVQFLRKDTAIFIIKLIAVGFFALQFTQHFEFIIGIMDGLLDIVTYYMTQSQVAQCDDAGMGQVLEARDAYSIWDRIDCLFITFLGLKAAGEVPESVLYVIGGMILVAQGYGVVIIAICIAFIITLLLAVVRSVKIYIVSVMAVAVLVITSIFFIPLLLFSTTKQYFDKWLMSLAAYMLIPIFLVAFLVMLIAVLDSLIYKGPQSLYWAIANRYSQEADFNFKDWIDVGASGKVQRDDEGKVVYANGEPVLLSGELVGRGIHNKYSYALLTYKQICETGSQEERDSVKDYCEKDLDQLIRCAVNPKVNPDVDSIGQKADVDNCEEVTGNSYYGFLTGESILHTGLATDIETDLDKRKPKDCGWFGWKCKLKSALGHIMKAFSVITGWISQAISTVGGWVASACSVMPVPGAVCAGTNMVFSVVGKVVGGVSTFYEMTGVFLLEGLEGLIGKLIKFDLSGSALDLRKIAMYHCSIDSGITDIYDYRALDPNICPGPEQILYDVLAIFVCLVVIAFLAFKWVEMIPPIGKQIVGNVNIDMSLPGEEAMNLGLRKAAGAAKAGAGKMNFSPAGHMKGIRRGAAMARKVGGDIASKVKGGGGGQKPPAP